MFLYVFLRSPWDQSSQQPSAFYFIPELGNSAYQNLISFVNLESLQAYLLGFRVSDPEACTPPQAMPPHHSDSLVATSPPLQLDIDCGAYGGAKVTQEIWAKNMGHSLTFKWKLFSLVSQSIITLYAINSFLYGFILTLTTVIRQLQFIISPCTLNLSPFCL